MMPRSRPPSPERSLTWRATNGFRHDAPAGDGAAAAAALVSAAGVSATVSIDDAEVSLDVHPAPLICGKPPPRRGKPTSSGAETAETAGDAEAAEAASDPTASMTLSSGSAAVGRGVQDIAATASCSASSSGAVSSASPSSDCAGAGVTRARVAPAWLRRRGASKAFMTLRKRLCEACEALNFSGDGLPSKLAWRPKDKTSAVASFFCRSLPSLAMR
mmetsp:Transcript_22363/g.79810  ORF Transcript_22363/g.79810 Transcript_22363/m.79810 type:complete len:217 (-) Transcript_22363:2020-2670(-)